MSADESSSELPHSLSIVLPAYNEGQAIEAVLSGFLAVARRFREREIIVVDDCSTDGTDRLLAELAAMHPELMVLRNDRNRGHGPSVLRGYARARFDYVFYADSDHQYEPEDFWFLWDALHAVGLDVAYGSRVDRKDGFFRDAVSGAMRLFLLALYGASLRDANGPFRLYRRAALDTVLPQIAEGAAFPNMLMSLAAYRSGLRVDWVPVRHLPRETGTTFLSGLKVPRLITTALGEALRFRFRNGGAA